MAASHLFGAGDHKAAEDRKQRQAEARDRLKAANDDSDSEDGK